MLRKTLTIFSLIGLLLSVGLWGASYWFFYYFNYPVSIGAAKGRVILIMWHPDVEDYAEMTAQEMTTGFRYRLIGKNIFAIRGFQGWHTWWALGYRVLIHRGRTVGTIRAFPLWIPTLTFGVWPAYALLHRRRRKRKRLGLCMKCGCDLRGSKHRCPECGEF